MTGCWDCWTKAPARRREAARSGGQGRHRNGETGDGKQGEIKPGHARQVTRGGGHVEGGTGLISG